MAGLLDFINSDDGRLGLGLLAAAGPRMAIDSGMGQRLQDAFGAQDNWKKTALAQKMGDLQYQSAIQSLEAATRRNKLINDMLSESKQPDQMPQAPQGPQPSHLSYFDSMPPAMRAGIENAPPAAPVSAPRQQVAQSPVYSGGVFAGLPRGVVASDLALNNGDHLSTFLNERTKPQLEMVNGVLIDKNKLPAGFSMPTVAQNGTASQLIPTPTAPGGFLVQAPQGAVDTYRGYKQADADIAAQNELVPVPMPNGTTRMMPKSMALSILGGGRPAPQAGGKQAPAAPGLGETQTPEANALNKGRAEKMVAYEDSLNGRVQEGASLNMRLQESLKTMENFKNGGGKETRAKMAQMAQAFGAPDKVVSGIAGGDLASMQEFNKLAVQQAMEQLKQSMGGAGRIAQAEFKVFQANNPNLDTDQNAVRKIYDFNTKLFNRDLDEQKSYAAHIDAGKNPASFPMLWQGQQARAGYTNPGLSANPGTKAPARPMKGMVQDGYKYEGGNPADPVNWEKQ